MKLQAIHSIENNEKIIIIKIEIRKNQRNILNINTRVKKSEHWNLEQ